MAARPTISLHRLACVAALVVVGLASPALAAPAPVPVLSEPVHDFAGVIDAASAARIDQISRSLQRGTGDVIVVVTIDTYQPDYGDIRDYAVKLFENHGRGIGDKEKDNGLLVVLAVKDRKVWVEVGYGLEGAITDGFAGETSRLYMAPAFREGNYGAGLLAGVTRFAARVAEERGVAIDDLPTLAVERPRPESIPIPTWALLLLLLVFIMMVRASRDSYRGSRRHRRGGGTVHWGGGSNWSGWGGGGSFGGGSFGGGFGGFGGGGSGGGGGGASW
jgi:uncharacterized protein